VLSQKTAVRPSLTVNLSNDATFLEGSKGEFAVRTPLELGFIDDSTLILSYDNRTNFEEDPALRNTFTVLSVSADSGVTLDRLQQDAPPGSSAATPTANGRFAVLSGTTLKLYAKDFRVERERDVPPPVCSNILITPGDFVHLRCIYNRQRLDVSPDGRTLLIRSAATLPLFKWTWFESSSFRQIAEWTAAGNENFHAGDNEFIAERGRGRPNLVTEQANRSLGDACWRSHFVASNLRLESSDNSLELKDASGAVIYRAKVNELTDELASSANSSRFVYVTVSGFGVLPQIGHRKMHFRMHVCDWRNRREIAAFNYDAPIDGPVIAAPDSAVAISPRGHVVVLLVGSSLMFFRI